MPDEKDNTRSSSLRGTSQISNDEISPFQKTAFAILQCFGITYIILPLIILVFGGPILREMTYREVFQKKRSKIYLNLYPTLYPLNLTFLKNHPRHLNHLSQKKCDINDYYPDPRSPNITSKITFFNIDIESSQNYKIAAWYFQGDPEKPFVIYSHGNADSRCGGYRLKGYNSLVARGYSVRARPPRWVPLPPRYVWFLHLPPVDRGWFDLVFETKINLQTHRLKKKIVVNFGSLWLRTMIQRTKTS